MRPRLVTGLTFLLFATALLFSERAESAPLPRVGVFVYSSLCTKQQSGDAAGYRLVVLRFGDGDRVFFDWSEGPLYSAEADKVTVDGSGTKISFMVQIPGTTEPVYASSFAGEISTEAAVINGVRVPRLYDLSQSTGRCQAAK